jgi:hypothetical protein
MKCVLCNKSINESAALDHYKKHEDFGSDNKVVFVISLLRKDAPISEIYNKMLEKFALKSSKQNLVFFESIVNYYDKFVIPHEKIEDNRKNCIKNKGKEEVKEETKPKLKSKTKAEAEVFGKCPAILKSGPRAGKQCGNSLMPGAEYCGRHSSLTKKVEAPARKTIRKPISPAPAKKTIRKPISPVKRNLDLELEEKESEELLMRLYEESLEEKESEELLMKLYEEDRKSSKPIKSKLHDLTKIPVRKEVKLMGDLSKKSPKLKPEQIRAMPPADLEKLQKHQPKIKAPKLKRLNIKSSSPKTPKLPSPGPSKSPAPLPYKSPAAESPKTPYPSPISPKPQRQKNEEIKQREESAAEPSQTILSFMQMKNPKPSKIIKVAPLLKKIDQSGPFVPPLSFYDEGGKAKLEDELYAEFLKLYDSPDVVFFFNQFLLFNKSAIDDFRGREGVDENIWHYLNNEMRIYVIYLKMNTILRKKFSRYFISEDKVNNMLNKESCNIQAAAINYFKEHPSKISAAKEKILIEYLEKFAPAAVSSFKSESKKNQDPPSEKELDHLYEYFDKQKREYNEFNMMYNKIQEYDPASTLLEPRILKLARLGMPDYDIAFILSADIEFVRNELNILSTIDYVKSHPKDAEVFTVEDLMAMFNVVPNETTFQRISFYKGL